MKNEQWDLLLVAFEGAPDHDLGLLGPVDLGHLVLKLDAVRRQVSCTKSGKVSFGRGHDANLGPSTLYTRVLKALLAKISRHKCCTGNILLVHGLAKR